MNPSWVVMAGGSSLSVSPPQRKVSVLAAVAGLAAGAAVGAAAGAAGGAAGAVVAAGAAVGGAAGGAAVGCGAGAGAQAASSPTPAVNPASRRKLRRLIGIDDLMAGPPLGCPSIVLDLQDSTAAAGSHAPLTPLPQPSPSRGEGWGEGREGSPEGDGILLSDSDASHQPVLLDGGTCDQE